MGVIFAEESITKIWLEVRELTKAHQAEVGFLGEEHFEPDLERYKVAELCSKTYTARVDGKIVGYANFFVHPHHHYPKTSWAVQDVLFMEKSFRGITAVKFIEWSDCELRAIGVNVVYRHVTAKCDYSRVLESFGYQLIEAGYARRL